jgi:hypothetical protein
MPRGEGDPGGDGAHLGSRVFECLDQSAHDGWPRHVREEHSHRARRQGPYDGFGGGIGDRSALRHDAARRRQRRHMITTNRKCTIS